MARQIGIYMEAAYIHPSAIVDAGASIGAGSKIWHFCHVMSQARIGSDCTLGQNVFVSSSARIGDRCRIQNNVSLYDGVELHDDVFCGPSVVFTNVRHPRAMVSRKHLFEPTIVQQGATLGANCTIVCGVTIGRFSFVAAGAVVTRNVIPHALVSGIPANQIGWVCFCGERLKIQTANIFHCELCESCFREIDGRFEVIKRGDKIDGI